MAYTKKIICLANSKKIHGKCVAGKELLPKGCGPWIRPISERPTAEILDPESRYESDVQPKLLDIIEISFVKQESHLHQTENHVIAKVPWKKTGEFPLKDIKGLVDSPEALWLNGDSSGGGTNDRVHKDKASGLTSSLFLIGPLNLVMHVIKVSTIFSLKKTVRASFEYNGVPYNLRVTDPIVEHEFLLKGLGDYKLDNSYICVSLAEPFDKDGCCYKLVAAILR